MPLKVICCPICGSFKCKITQVREHYWALECKTCDNTSNIWIMDSTKSVNQKMKL